MRKHWYDWEQVEQGRAHEHVFAHVQGIEKVQSEIHANNREYARLYSNRYEPGLGVGRGQDRSGDLVTENVIKSVVDTATSLIGKTRPKLRVLSDNATWSLQLLAKQVEKYLNGMFQGLRLHGKLTAIFRDACVWGTGVLHLQIRKGEIRAERVLIDQIVVDEEQCPTGELPRELHRVRRIHREVLKSIYPDYAKEIDDSRTGFLGVEGGLETDPDMVLVGESWHLGPKGRYSVWTDKCTLEDKQYTEECYPFVFYHWTPPLTGFYGQGLAEELLGFQIRLNELNDFIQKCQDLIAVPRIALDASSRMLKPTIDNEIGALLYYNGKPPQFFTAQAVSPEIYQYKEQLKQSAFEFAGISKMAAQATRPEGIEHAVAMRELSDNQSQRFSTNQQRFEDAAVETGELLLRLARKLHSTGKAPRVYMAEKFVEEIDWPAVDMDKQRFVLSVQPASIMSETPAGRLQRVIELAQYGVQLDQMELRRLLGQPDIGLSDARATSALEDIEWTIEQLAKGELEAPESFQDLELGIERITAAYLEFKRMRMPEENLALFREWLREAGRIQTEARSAANAQMQASAGMTGMDPAMAGMAGQGQPAPLLPPSAALDAGALPGLLVPPAAPPF